MRAEKGTHKSSDWVVGRLQSWGAWAKTGGPSGYGESCLTMEEVRSMPVRAYVPITTEDCERTHEALRKLPAQLYNLAVGLYVEGEPMRLAVRRVRVSEQHGWRLRNSLLSAMDFLLKNPKVRTPPLHLLLKS